jgi:hypothetical protein
LLADGIAPRIEFLVEETKLPEETLQAYLNSASWVRKDDSSPAGIVFYLPTETASCSPGTQAR